MEWEALAARVTRLERLNRRLLFGCAALLVLCAGLGAAAVERNAEFGVVSARAFVIKDVPGNVRGVLGFLEVDGENGLAIMGKDGVSGIAIRPGASLIKVTRSDGTIVNIE